MTQTPVPGDDYGPLHVVDAFARHLLRRWGTEARLGAGGLRRPGGAGGGGDMELVGFSL